MPQSLVKGVWVSHMMRDRAEKVQLAVAVFKGPWLVALLDASFSRDTVYYLLHPDDQQVVTRVLQEVAGIFPGVTKLIEVEAAVLPAAGRVGGRGPGNPQNAV